MPKLANLKPRIGTLSPRIGYQPSDEQARSRHRDATQPWRAWYKTARWQKLRWAILVRDMFTCAMCGRIEHDTSELHCDHVEPHRGDEAKFWSGPFQTLCHTCHNGLKQRADKSGIEAKRFDPANPWDR